VIAQVLPSEGSFEYANLKAAGKSVTAYVHSMLIREVRVETASEQYVAANRRWARRRFVKKHLRITNGKAEKRRSCMLTSQEHALQL
jgi:hypothetical protein